jgi:uncharacterized protein (DUF1330 family)
MSAYIVIEGTVRDKDALGGNGSQATQSIKEFGGEVLAFGPWDLIFGERPFHNGMIVRFPARRSISEYGWQALRTGQHDIHGLRRV